MENNKIYKEIILKAEALAPELSKIRRDFHRHPELGWMEMRTSAKIAGLLQEYGCDEVLTGRAVCREASRMGVPSPEILSGHYQDVLAQEGDSLPFLPDTEGGFTGVIGILRCGVGPTVAFRFDIDALPIQECPLEEHFPRKNGFASENAGVMHACGHDGHTAVGLGAAKILCGLRDRLRGTVKFIFQPAEEGVRGAKAIVDAGHLDDVDYVFGAHMGGTPEQPEPMIGIGDGHSLATVKLDVDFHGKSAHAANAPECGNNAMLAAATAVLNLHAIPRHGQATTRVNVGKLIAGPGRNIICDSAHMEMEVRGMSSEANQYMYDYARRIVTASAQMHGCTCEIQTVGAAISGINSSELMDLTEKICRDDLHLKTERLPSTSGGVSEDYSYMSERVQARGGQSCYFMNLSRCPAGIHNDGFDFQEEALVNGVKAFAGIAVRLLS